jgi:hypothetical protein
VTQRRYDPSSRRVTPEVLAFYKKEAVRLRFEARRQWRRRLCAWVAGVLRHEHKFSTRHPGEGRDP